MVTVLLITIDGELLFHATSDTVPERMFILIIPFQVAVTVTSNLVLLNGDISKTELHTEVPTNDPLSTISLQVKLPVLMASVAETKNLSICHEVKELCPVDKLIDNAGLIKSKTQGEGP